MFLEKLEIFGFKAIPYRLSVKFGAGITAICGPNGCGKSNLSDAIRWVLGEQSVRHLRGHAMEDVIFNGTAARKPLGMSEVYLTFSNARNRLPIDFDTVTVGRRLYRSGQSEYLINKAGCRLKDVKDLLLDTGIGSSGYAMIAREMVEAVLSDDSGQRRMLLEEAAGVAKYKQRKREALSKLKATEQDLVRVADIVTEVEREVRSLGRQVGKARRYRHYLERIRKLDLALSRQRIHHLAARRDELEPLLVGHRAEVEGQRARQSTLETELESHRLSDVELERVLSEAQASLDSLDRDLATWDSEAKVLRERRSATRHRVEQATRDVERLGARITTNAELHEKARAALESLAVVEEEQARELRQRELALSEADRGWRAARADLGERKQLHLDLVEDHAGRRVHLEQVDRRIAELDGRLSARRDECEEARHELARRDGHHQRAGDELAAMRAQTEATALELEQGEERVTVLDSSLVELTAQHTALSEGVAVGESRLEVLYDLKRRYEGHAQGVQSLLRDGRPRGLHGTVSELLQVPADFVRAVDTALGGAVGYIVADRRLGAGEHIDRLRRDDAGRATFLPLEDLETNSRPPVPEGNGILGVASRLVNPSDSGHTAIVDYLLGDVLVVADRTSALELVSRADLRGYRVVTLDGELWSRGGAVAGGAQSAGSSSPLGREQEIASLASELASLQAELDSVIAERQRVSQDLEEAVARRDALRSRAASERETVFELEKAVQAAELAVHAQTETIAELDRILGELEHEHGEFEGERSELGEALDTARSKSDTFEADYAELEIQATKLEEVRESRQKAEQEMRLSYTELVGRFSEARTEDERLVSEAQMLTTELERRRQEIADGGQQIDELETTIGRLESQSLDGLVEREGRETRVREAETAHAEARAQSLEIEDAARALRHQIDERVSTLHAEELEHERVRGEIESTSVRVREEYEVELLETVEVLDEEQTEEAATQELAGLRDRMRTLGPVNLLAIEQHDEIKERFDFLTQQRDDLTKAREELLEAIERINRTASQLFHETFATVRENFMQVFETLFEGGQAELKLIGDELDGIIEIMARPRGKNLRSVSLMSGGERALTAISLLFAIYLAKPSPFCIMDEVDAPLDDANVDRFVSLLHRFSDHTQFIVITHNKKTMAAAERLYGVTMEEPGVSKLVSVRLEQGEIRQTADDGVERDEPSGRGASTPKLDGPARPIVPEGDTAGDGEEPQPQGDIEPVDLDAATIEAELDAEAILAPAAGGDELAIAEPVGEAEKVLESS